MVINNFEVEDFEEEEPEIHMLGGIRGLRALKVQRDYLKDADTNKQDDKEGPKTPTHNRFARYD